MLSVDEYVKLSNELTEKRIRDNLTYINNNKDKWEEIYQKYKPYNHIELCNDKQVYLERDTSTDWKDDINIDNADDLFKYLVCRIDPRANVEHYLEKKLYDLINY